MRLGVDVWIDTLSGGMRRVCERGGGIRGASPLEAALWDRLLSEKLLRGPPRWYHERRLEQGARKGEEG